MNIFKKKRIKLVAIAKDEGAYLTDWVFHHLYFGFSAIEIFINRTADNSIEILDGISKNHPEVSYQEIDWVDQVGGAVTNRIQQISYSLSFYQSKSDFDYILFLDIDEFWTPNDFKSSISTVLSGLNRHTPIAFEWLCELGSKEEFIPLRESFGYFQSGLVKSIIPTSSSVKIFRCHLPIFNNEQIVLLADGTPFIADSNNDQKLESTRLGKKNSYIIHRMFRSEVEYLATLYRGNPEGISGLKANRRGGYLRDEPEKPKLELPKFEYKKYLDQRSQFIKKNRIFELIELAKKSVILRSNLTLGIIVMNLEKEPDIIRDTIKGLTNPIIDSIDI